MDGQVSDRKIFMLLGAVVGTNAAGGLAGIATADAIKTWYTTLEKPPFNPPSGVFGPVWTLLYTLMGIALYLVSTGKGVDRGAVRLAQILYGLQLGLNLAWTLIFFGLRSPLGALVEIVFLWLAILVTIAAFWRVSRPAALLLVPYLAWTSFAAILNLELWRLNRSA